MSTEDRLPRTRFLDTLGLVRHEGKHLAYSLGRVFSQPVNGAWVRALEQYPEQAERLEAFVSRYGRMQDTIGEKLLPRWLLALSAAKPAKHSPPKIQPRLTPPHQAV